MKHIQKKISLEQFKSRMPSIVPAFYDIGKYYEFDGKSNFDDNNRIPCTNYGLVPYSIKWDRGKYKFYVDENNIEHFISFKTLSSWFHFIEFYINLLKKHGCLTNNYISAEEYGKFENNDSYDSDDYLEFDRKIIEICQNDDDKNKTLYDIAVNTYNDMIITYFPRFEIEEKYQNAWNKKFLSINEVNYWINWFQTTRDKIEIANNINECIKTTNYCDCKLFFNLGGSEMLEKLKKFISNYFILHRIDKKYISITEINNWISWFEKMTNELTNINDISDCYNIENCEECIKFFKLNKFVNLEYLKKIKTNIIEKFSNEEGNLIILEIRNLVNWLEGIANKLNGITDSSECANTDFCEDCEKFFNLGGYEILNELKEFISIYDLFFIYIEPELKINIKLSTSIDDLGEYSTFYEDWEGGIDYSYSNGNTNNGAIIQYNNQDWILEKGKGYIYSKEFKEYYFGTKSGMTENELLMYNDNTISNLVGEDNQLSRLIEKKSLDENNHPIFEFNGGVSHDNKYSYDFYGNKITFSGEITDDLCKKIFQKFQIINSNNGFFEIKGIIYESNNFNYIIYNNICYEVKKDNSSNYISNINGINYYSVFSNGIDYFTINGKNIPIYNGNGIKINDNLFIENNNKIKYGAYTYNKIFKYSIVNGENVLLDNNLKIVSQILNELTKEYEINIDDTVLGEFHQSLGNNLNGYTTDNNYLYIVAPFTTYDSDKITGYTESKLSSFISATNIVYDNLGNKLPGTYIEESELKDGNFIGLMYKPNTTIHLSKEIDENGNITYWGDYLKDIIIYYVDNINNTISSKKTLNNDGNLIKIVNDLNEELNGKYGKLMCDFIYYMGCTMKIQEDTNIVEIIDDGVKYIDTTELVEKTCKYFINDYTCYILKYYDVVHEEINYNNSTYNFNSYVNKSQFTISITNFMKDNTFKCNGWVDFPVIREEYKLGSSSLENIDVDVNIDRGTARAFDQHIKLLEVNSLESLEQYGNGYFNIITN